MEVRGDTDDGDAFTQADNVRLDEEVGHLLTLRPDKWKHRCEGAGGSVSHRRRRRLDLGVKTDCKNPVSVHPLFYI